MSENIHIEDADFEEPDMDSQEEVYYPERIDDDFLSQIINLGGDDIYHEPTCPICSSPYRKEIEEKWFETKDYKDIQAILKNSKIKNVSEEVIKNHIYHHFQKGIMELKKKEYIDRISRINGQNNLSSLDRINFALSVLSERLVSLNSISSSDDLSIAEVEKIKTAETKKIMDTYAKYLKMQSDLMGEMTDAGEMIKIPKNSFVQFFNELIIDSETDAEKNIIKKVLTGLRDLSTDQ